jgi:hypothetical protein
MYQIKCDKYILYDPRDDDLIVNKPKCKLAVNTVGEASFTILSNHPFYGHIQKMRSVFEINQDEQTIFRGRMTDDTIDFENAKGVDLEGVGAFLNDSVVRPFLFPENFLDDENYIAASTSGNVIEFFLSWLIENHNSQVEDFQKFKLGNVTVVDSTNYISRSSNDYAKTWETLKSKLFESGLGGYFCFRYEDDGNYIDYLSDFEFTNNQRVIYGENLLDLKTESDASASCSAVLPLGKKLNEIDANTDDESRLTIKSLADGDVTDDIYKQGDLLISRKAKESYGLVIAHPKDTTWDDVTLATNLQSKGVEYLATTASKLSNTIEIKAVDLHFTDDEIAAFRIYRYIEVESKPHGHKDRYRLTQLDIDIMNPQNTKISLGDTKLSMTDINRGTKKSLEEQVASVTKQTTSQGVDLSEVQNIVSSQSSSLVTTCEDIILSAMSDYVETSNYSSFKETVEAQLKIMADEISFNFTNTIDQIEKVNGDLQEKFNTITKYFTFDIDGLTIGQTDNPYRVVIDNDRFSMQANGVEVLWLDAEGKAHIPELDVTKKIALLGFLIDQDENGNVNCEYIGG